MTERVPTLKVVKATDRPRVTAAPPSAGELLQSLDEAISKARWVVDTDPATVSLARALAREIDEALARWDVVYTELRVFIEDATVELDARDAQTLLRLMRKLVERDHPMQVLGAVAQRYRELLGELGLSPAGRRRVDMSPKLPFGEEDGVDLIRNRLRARREAWAKPND